MKLEGQIHRAFKFRLYPTGEQRSLMAQFAGGCRFIYNLALEQRRDWYRQFKATTGSVISFASQCRELTTLRSEVDWIGAAPRCIQSQALRELDEAFQRFFKSGGGYPSPRAKGHNDSFCVGAKEMHSPIVLAEGARFGKVKLPKLGWCNFRASRALPAQYRLLEAIVTLDPLGWHICLSVVMPAPEKLGLAGSVGIDRGIANTLAFSDGEFASLPVERLRSLARKAKHHQRRIARQRHKSKRSAASKRLLAKVQAHAARIRAHWNHERTTQIAASYGTVAIEALRTASMTRSARGTVEAPGSNVRQKAGLNRSILEQGWYQFERMLTYKLAAAGGALVKVDPADTSRACSACGSISDEHRKSQAVFLCTDCGHSAHADINAALNIKRAGEQPAWRGAVKPPMKREPDMEQTL